MLRIVDISVEPGFLRAVVAGDYSLEAAQRITQEIIEAAGRHRVDAVLIDGLEVCGAPSNMDRFQYGNFIADANARLRDKGLATLPKFAYVLKAPMAEPERFAETVAINRGMKVRMFDDHASAIAWLGMGISSRRAPNQ